MKKLRLYIDTSVIGGCLDPEFADDSLSLIRRVRSGKAIMLMSDVTIQEIRKAPAAVQRILDSIPFHCIEPVELSDEIQRLRNAYIKAGIVASKHLNDATQVACASVAHADAIVSWNFKHIVNLKNIKGYNEVNLNNGYSFLTIVTPKEAIFSV